MHMEVPRLGVELEVQLPAYAPAMTMQDPSHACDLHHSSQQCLVPDPLSEARDQTRMDNSRICFHYATAGTPLVHIFSARIFGLLLLTIDV